ncbi:hypothetical protein MVEG_12068 [Podila verticillata NRRL 6337]|uniref:Voltage-gated hydrogen channel 1 n=1 Tax=Podila verticillata NRRL 6337 TaxID=1069443 RepID=A0A086TL49_9FUNG|nr:hypothetical protein MVEG_12068 [Podila verticillata NRRL 6337]
MDNMETVHSYVVTTGDPQQHYQQLQQQCFQLQQQNLQLQQQVQHLQQNHELDHDSSIQLPQQKFEHRQPQYPDPQQVLVPLDASQGQPQLEILPSDEKLAIPPERTLSALYRTRSTPVPTHSTIAQESYGETVYDARNRAHITSYHNQYISSHPLHAQHFNQEGGSSYRNKSCIGRFRHRFCEAIESKGAHITILILTLIDIILVMLEIGASLLHLDETEEEVWYLELFSHLSLAIVSLFMLEILMKFFAFGPRYFWRGTPHWFLHLVDAVIIMTSFMLEIFLHGAGQELSSLLIVFRLWRVVKLTGTVAVEVSSHEQENAALLEVRVHELEKELGESKLRCQKLEGFTSQLRPEIEHSASSSK